MSSSVCCAVSEECVRLVQVLVEAQTLDGEAHSLLLQNAETVRLIGPSVPSNAASNRQDRKADSTSAESSISSERSIYFGVKKKKEADVESGIERESAEKSEGRMAWRALSVSELQLGDQVYVLRQAAARHTGISIKEFVSER